MCVCDMVCTALVCFTSFRLSTHSFSFVLLFVDYLLFPACRIVRGTMYGVHMGNAEYTLQGRPYCSDPNLYIFAVYDGKFYKMTAVSFENAKASSKPLTPVEKYLEAARDSINLDDSVTLCKLWDGDGYGTITKQAGTPHGYDLKDVTVTACGSYMTMYAHC